jgi:hypothetical protein
MIPIWNHPKKHNPQRGNFMETLVNIGSYISVGILILFWIVLLLAALSDDTFQDGKQDKRPHKFLPRDNPNNPSETEK